VGAKPKSGDREGWGKKSIEKTPPPRRASYRDTEESTNHVSLGERNGASSKGESGDPEQKHKFLRLGGSLYWAVYGNVGKEREEPEGEKTDERGVSVIVVVQPRNLGKRLNNNRSSNEHSPTWAGGKKPTGKTRAEEDMGRNETFRYSVHSWGGLLISLESILFQTAGERPSKASDVLRNPSWGTSANLRRQ